jgi:signal transduction histidine kinase
MKRLRDRRRPTLLLVGTATYIGLVCVIDSLLPPPVDVWVLYLPLILLLTKLDAPVLIIAATVACTLLMTLDIVLQEYELGVPFILLILGTRFIALWLVAFSGVILVRSARRRKELEREVLEAAANEQQRIGQELHDSVGQELTGLGLMVNALAARLRENIAETQIMSRLSAGLIRLQQHIRTLSHGLLPVPVMA